LTQILKSQDSWALAGMLEGGVCGEKEGQVTNHFVVPCIELE